MELEEYKAALQVATPSERAVLMAKIGADESLSESQRRELGAELRRTRQQETGGGRTLDQKAWAEVSLVNAKLKGMQYEMEAVLDKLNPSLEEDAITVFCITLGKLRGKLDRRAADKEGENGTVHEMRAQ